MILDALKTGWGVARDIIGRSDARSAENRAVDRDKVKIQTLVKDARAADIHPLAAMGSQIAGAYGSSGNVYTGNAAGEALNSVNRPDALAEENRRLQNESLKADIDRTRADTARIIAASATSRSDIAGASARTRGANAGAAPPLRLFGGTIQRNPDRFSSSDLAEQEFGQAGEYLFGVPALIDSIGRALTELPKSIPGKRLPGSQWTR